MGDSFATLDDLCITRDAQGNIDPLEVETPYLGRKVKILPLTLRASLSFEHRAESVTEFPPEDKARLIREHVVEPDCSQLTDEQIIDGMDGMTVDDLVTAVSIYSGAARTEAQADGKKKGKR